ncbi:putative non-specific serine/threonine protein kinase [Rosa chinensis]|uniref:non-specific serine/threonine protein kinase n=1 Tax=Rosa chinensis TaxID=74649 RepID=A0A2P6RU56_ROSCH|nr:putative non-specific serine/threonine protein kinase [Rosa chinensis]
MDINKRNRFISSYFLLQLCIALRAYITMGSGSLSPGQFLLVHQKITSPRGIFELGFFTPGNSQNYYIGIWYKNVPNQIVVWVANRNQPIIDPTSSSFVLLENGNLTLNSPSMVAIWSTNSTSKGKNSTIAMLLDNGNFVIRDAFDSSDVIWQSFDHPTDTWLPGAKLGYNMLTKESLILTPWRNPENPVPSLNLLGSCILILSHLGLAWFVQSCWFRDMGAFQYSCFELRTLVFGGLARRMSTSFISCYIDIHGVNFSCSCSEEHSPLSSCCSRSQPTPLWPAINSKKRRRRASCAQTTQTRWSLQRCPSNLYLCGCLKGFEPKVAEDWKLEDHSEGCVRNAPFNCSDESNNTFIIMPHVLYPVNFESFAVANLDECKSACLRNCSCTAFAYDSQCLVWKGDLFNLRQLTSDGKLSKALHLRVAAFEKNQMIDSTDKKRRETTWIVIVVLSSFFGLLSFMMVFIRKKQSSEEMETDEDSLLLFKYKDLRRATHNFSQKIGEGAFGSVFKVTSLLGSAQFNPENIVSSISK